MIENVVDFLVETKKSYKKFDKLIEFYDFKDKVVHIQHFKDVCDLTFEFFKNEFHAKNLKVTTYDIEQSLEKKLYCNGDDFNENLDPFVFSFDFSKSYALNGRIFFQVSTNEEFEEISDNKNYLEYIFFELRTILSNYLAIEKLKESSYVDHLTELPNRRFLLKHLNSLLPLAKKENIQIAFLKIEVDRLKAVIEEFDYEISNKVIKLLSKVLQKNISDTDLLTKFEGESFLICMQDVKTEDEIINLANKCIEDFASQSVVVNQKTNQTLKKTICVGISLYPDDSDELNDIFKNLDIALDEARNKGRSSYEFYKEEQNSAIDLF